MLWKLSKTHFYLCGLTSIVMEVHWFSLVVNSFFTGFKTVQEKEPIEMTRNDKSNRPCLIREVLIYQMNFGNLTNNPWPTHPTYFPFQIALWGFFISVSVSIIHLGNFRPILMLFFSFGALFWSMLGCSMFGHFLRDRVRWSGFPAAC